MQFIFRNAVACRLHASMHSFFLFFFFLLLLFNFFHYLFTLANCSSFILLANNMKRLTWWGTVKRLEWASVSDDRWWWWYGDKRKGVRKWLCVWDSKRKVTTVGHLGRCPRSHSSSPRCPTVGTFRLLSHLLLSRTTRHEVFGMPMLARRFGETSTIVAGNRV